ncbi:MAG TPA: hypothetical protein VGW12_15425 [Pyrinomonadaceae bacterium]|nr:hypothetical protein [Pyrinomonadaceae bacterium]
MTIPAVPLPMGSGVRTPIDLKLKAGWRYDSQRRAFESDRGERFSPRGELPKNSKIVYKVPNLARADESKLNEHERDLRLYMQVILPEGESPAAHVGTVRAWPCVAEAHAAPEISLPNQF